MTLAITITYNDDTMQRMIPRETIATFSTMAIGVTYKYNQIFKDTSKHRKIVDQLQEGGRLHAHSAMWNYNSHSR